MNLQDWIVFGLAVVFVALYVLAVAGVLQPPSNDKLVGTAPRRRPLRLIA